MTKDVRTPNSSGPGDSSDASGPSDATSPDSAAHFGSGSATSSSTTGSGNASDSSSSSSPGNATNASNATSPASPNNNQPGQKRRSFLGHPLGLLNLFSTEFCERFSYYGMRAILVYFLYETLANGGLGLTQAEAMIAMSLFGSFVYLSSILGGWLADRVLGSYKAILFGGIIIALGHVILGLPLAIPGVVAAMLCIVFGTGLLKPNVSVMVGELYSRSDQRRQAGFSMLYFAINAGSFISPLIVGAFAQKTGYHIAFTIPAVVMLVGLFIYVGLSKRTLAGIGRSPVVPLTPKEQKRWGLIFIAALIALLAVFGLFGLFGAQGEVGIRLISDAVPIICILAVFGLFVFMFRDRRVKSEERGRLKTYIPLFIISACFSAISEQQSSTIPVVVKEMVNNDFGLFTFPATWYPSINPLIIIILSPVFAALWTKLASRQPSMVTKMTLGLALAASGFVLLACGFFFNELPLSPIWLFVSLFFITIGELLLSPTGLSATTLLAPDVHRSKMMGLWFLSVSLGISITTVTVPLFEILGAGSYYLIFALVSCVVAALVFLARNTLLRLAGGVR